MGPYVDCCVFCGSRERLTDEHVYGDWIKKYVPVVNNKHFFEHIDVYGPDEEVRRTPRVRAGDLLGANIRIVCHPCNSGWMSRLQSAAKPFLIPLFLGEASVLTPRAQSAITAWLCMATITGEYFTRDGIFTVTELERATFYHAQRALVGWRFWLGKYKSTACETPHIRSTFPILKAEELARIIHDENGRHLG